MLLFARLLLVAVCALAAPAAHARSWVMTPDPAVLPFGIEHSAIDTPPDVIGLVNDQESLSLFYDIIGCGGIDCFFFVHFDQQPVAGWWDPDPSCFVPGEAPFSMTPSNREVAPGVRMDSTVFSDPPCSGTLTFEFSQFPTQIDFWMLAGFVQDWSSASATVEVAALAPTLGSLGMALLAAGFVLATLVAARPMDRCRRLDERGALGG